MTATPISFVEMRRFVLADKAAPWLLLTALYVLLTPNIDFTIGLNWHDGQRLAQLVLFGIVGFSVLIPSTGRAICDGWMRTPKWSRYALVSALLLGLVSSTFAQYPRWAFLEWSTLVMTGLLAIAVSVSWRRHDVCRDVTLIFVFYATALAYSVKAVTMYLTMTFVGPDYGLGLAAEELFTGFSNIRFFGHVQTMLLPFLLLPVMFWSKDLRHRAAWMIVPAVWWMLAIASGTRGSWVALMFGATVAAVLGSKAGRQWFRWQLSGFACGMLLYGFFFMLLPLCFSKPAELMHRGADIISLRGRDVLWDLANGLMLQNPIFGIGPMHFANRVSALGAHPHNAILQLMAEWGVPAAILFCVVFVVGGLSWAKFVHIQTRDKNPDRETLVLVSLLAAITGACVQAMVDGVIVVPVSQTLLALMCGWAIGSRFSKEQEAPASNSGATKVFRVAVFVAMVGIVAGVYPEIGRLAERESLHLIKQPPGPNPLLLPRFWLHGLIPD